MKDPERAESRSPEHLRELLLRHGLRNQRFREAVARSLGMPSSDLAALAYLSFDESMTPTQLARELCLTSGGTTALVQRLQRRGYVVRAGHPDDARRALLSLTPTAVTDLSGNYASLVADLDRLAHSQSAEERAAVGRYLYAAGQRTGEAADDALSALARRANTSRGPSVPCLWA